LLTTHLTLARVFSVTPQGANVGQTKPAGCTALIFAVFQRHTAVARLLLERGADVDQALLNGATPLFMATKQVRVEGEGLRLSPPSR
jgi:ankyrin repeat protein